MPWNRWRYPTPPPTAMPRLMPVSPVAHKVLLPYLSATSTSGVAKAYLSRTAGKPPSAWARGGEPRYVRLDLRIIPGLAGEPRKSFLVEPAAWIRVRAFLAVISWWVKTGELTLDGNDIRI